MNDALYGYRNDGNETFSRARVGVDFNQFPACIAVMDIDNDGDIDLFVTNNFPFEVVFYRNEGPTGVTGESSPESLRGFAFGQNHPNPFLHPIGVTETDKTTLYGGINDE